MPDGGYLAALGKVRRAVPAQRRVPLSHGELQRDVLRFYGVLRRVVVAVYAAVCRVADAILYGIPLRVEVDGVLVFPLGVAAQVGLGDGGYRSAVAGRRGIPAGEGVPPLGGVAQADGQLGYHEAVGVGGRVGFARAQVVADVVGNGVPPRVEDDVLRLAVDGVLGVQLVVAAVGVPPAGKAVAQALERRRRGGIGQRAYGVAVGDRLARRRYRHARAVEYERVRVGRPRGVEGMAPGVALRNEAHEGAVGGGVDGVGLFVPAAKGVSRPGERLEGYGGRFYRVRRGIYWVARYARAPARIVGNGVAHYIPAGVKGGVARAAVRDGGYLAALVKVRRAVPAQRRVPLSHGGIQGDILRFYGVLRRVVVAVYAAVCHVGDAVLHGIPARVEEDAVAVRGGAVRVVQVALEEALGDGGHVGAAVVLFGVPVPQHVSPLGGGVQGDGQLRYREAVGVERVGCAPAPPVADVVGGGVPPGVERGARRHAVNGIGGILCSAAAAFGKPAAQRVAQPGGVGQAVYPGMVGYGLAGGGHRYACAVEDERVGVGRPRGVERGVLRYRRLAEAPFGVSAAGIGAPVPKGVSLLFRERRAGRKAAVGYPRRIFVVAAQGVVGHKEAVGCPAGPQRGVSRHLVRGVVAVLRPLSVGQGKPPHKVGARARCLRQRSHRRIVGYRHGVEGFRVARCAAARRYAAAVAVEVELVPVGRPRGVERGVLLYGVGGGVAGELPGSAVGVAVAGTVVPRVRKGVARLGGRVGLLYHAVFRYRLGGEDSAVRFVLKEHVVQRFFRPLCVKR